MSRVLYLDCSSGASGDMVLGALLDLGLPLDELRGVLGDLLPPGADLGAARVVRSGISAMSFTVTESGASASAEGKHAHRDHHHDHRHHRSIDEVDRLIGRARLDPDVRDRARALYRTLAEAEAAIHDMPVDLVHLHEVGALDSVVDVVGAVWAIARLEVDRVVASPLNVGAGHVDTAHGRLQVPAPATLRLLRGVPVYSEGPAFERVTPTGALLITGHVSTYGPLPAMRIQSVGYGAGSRDIEGQPNVLRAILGIEGEAGDHHRVVVLECNIDDMNPQIFGVLMDRLLGAGALDVYYTPVQMKKGRPGTLVTVVAPPDRRDAISALLFADTTTIGIRRVEMDRECLARESVMVETRYGPVRFKVARRGQAIMNAAPEFDDCARLAAEHQCPAKKVQAEAVRAYLAGRGPI